MRSVLLEAQRQATEVGWMPESKPGTSGAQGKVHEFAQVLPVTAASGAHGMQRTGAAHLTHSSSSILVQFAFFEKAVNVIAHV